MICFLKKGESTVNHNDYPRLKSMLLGAELALGKAVVFCAACGMECDINKAEEISVHDYESIKTLSMRQAKTTSFFIICERCRNNHAIQASIDGVPYPFKPSPANA